MGKRKRLTITITKIAIALAAVTTVMAMTASGTVVATGGRNFAERMHMLALGIMLIAYLFLVVVLIACKPIPIVSLCVVEQEQSLMVSPCGRDGYIVLNQTRIDRSARGAFEKIPKRTRAMIRIIVARDVSVPDDFLDSLALFPNVSLLDLQGAKVPPEFWLSLEELPNVTHVLATNAIPAELLRNISISLPEVKFWMGHTRSLVIGSNAAMKPHGYVK